MATTVANLLIKFESDTNNAVRGIDRVNASISSVEKNTMGVGASLSRFGLMAGGVAAAGVVALGGAMAATAVDGFNMASDLEAGMSAIASTMQKSRDEIAPLKQLILDLGMNENLKVSTLEAAAAINSLAENGQAMTDILNGAAEATVLLSNATGGDFAVSAGIMTDVMKQFKNSAGSYTEAVSGIVAVTTKSKFSIDDYRLAVAQAGGVASSVGVEFGDFNTTLAAISPLFGSGSDAGTSFKTMLQTLIPKSGDAATAMQKLGLLAADGSNAFFDASGSLKSMADISSILAGALNGLSEEQKNAALSTIFGSDAMRAAVALADSGKVVYTDVALAAKELGVSQEALNAVAKDGITAFEALQVRMGQVDALDAAAERMNNTKGALEILSGVVETVKIQIGDAFLPVVRQLAETLSSFVSENSGRIVGLFAGFAGGIGVVAAYIPSLLDGLIGLVEGMGNLWVSIQTTINAWQPFVAAVLAALAPVAEAIGSFISWKDILIVLGGIISGSVVVALGGLVASMAPVVGVVLGAIAVVSLMRNAWENDWGGVRTIVLQAVDAVSAAVASLDFAGMKAQIDAVVGKVQSGWLFIKDSVTVAVQEFSWADFVASLTWENVVTTLSDWGAFIAPIAWDGLVTAIDWATYIGKLVWDNALVPALEWAAYVAPIAWDALISTLSDWGAYIAPIAWDVLVAALDWAAYVAPIAWDALISTLSDWGAYIAPIAWDVLVAALDWAAYVAPIAWDALVSTLSDWGAYITALDWTSIITTVIDWATWIPALSWTAFITGIEWSAYLGAIEWSAFIGVLDWATATGAGITWADFINALEWVSYIAAFTWDSFVTKLEWTGVIAKLSSWGDFISALDWTQIITTVIDWATWIPALGWNTFVKVLEWSVIIGYFAWSSYISKWDWNSAVSTLTWENFVTALSDWGQFVAKLVSWTGFIASLTWSSFVAKLSWPFFVPKLSWPNISFPGWKSFVPSFAWPSIPPFPGWSAVTNLFGGGEAETPQKTRALPGPQKTRALPGERSLSPTSSTAPVAAGAINITINATVANELDLEALAYRLAAIMKRRG